MKLDHPLVYAYGGLLARLAVRTWLDTLDAQVACYDPAADPASPAGRRRIYVFWHEYILLPFHMGTAVLRCC